MNLISDVRKGPSTEGIRKPKTVRDLPPGSISYQIHEMQREPDERIASLVHEWDKLHEQLFDYPRRHDIILEKVRERLKEIDQTLEELRNSPERVCRLLHLRGNPAFAEWLVQERRPTPTILRFGVALPPAEQDGYYQKDYLEWRNVGSPAPRKETSSPDIKVRQEDSGGLC
jgi:hypothetical protein